jgi:hypothetical protein
MEYWSRDGTVLLTDMLGKVAGTSDFEYWARNGSIVFQTAIQPPPSSSTEGLLTLFAAAGWA